MQREGRVGDQAGLASAGHLSIECTDLVTCPEPVAGRLLRRPPLLG